MRKLLNQELDRITEEEFKKAIKTPIVVVLDNVRSLHNVGSIFRTCDAFLIQEIILCGITGCPPNKEMEKTALGSTNTVVWKYCQDTLKAVQALKIDGYTVLSIEQAQGSISLEKYQPQSQHKYALVFGNEVAGVDQQVVNACEGVIEIPQLGTKHSLNISVSSGIVLWSFFKALRS